MADLSELDDLVAAVEADAGSDDPLELLAAAGRIRDGLDDLAEALLDHFVEGARVAGCSWSEVGTAIGVSKQAAQQRHTAEGSIVRRLVTRVSDLVGEHAGGPRFTERTRRAVEASEAEARRMRHRYVGTEHLLLGLLTEPEAVGPRALVGVGLDLGTLRGAIEEMVPPGDHAPGRHLPFTPRAKKALQLALREALALGHNYIGTEHLVLGLLREGGGIAHEVLAGLGADHDAVRAEVNRLLAGYTQA
jgi:hypothetical protein